MQYIVWFFATNNIRIQFFKVWPFFLNADSTIAVILQFIRELYNPISLTTTDM